MEDTGLVISGKSPDWKLVEFIELENYPYFVAIQAYLELKSSLENPHPLFVGLIESSLLKKLQN